MLLIRNVKLIVPSVVLFLTVTINAGQRTMDGSQPGSFDDRSVIVAVFSEAKPYPAGEPGPSHHATLRPVATIAGTFDCSTHPVLDMSFTLGLLTSSIARIPSEGSYVLAVIETKPPTQWRPKESAGIVSDACTFMPRGSPLVELAAPDDPLIERTLRKIQAERLKPGPETRPSTQESTSPKASPGDRATQSTRPAK